MNDPGNLISRVANDTRMAQTALTSISSDLIKQPLTVISAFAVLIHLDWKFTDRQPIPFPGLHGADRLLRQEGSATGET